MSELSWLHLNTSIWKVQGIASRAQRPLTTALWDNNFPSLRGATWRNNGSSTRNGARFDLDDRHLSGEYGHPWGEIIKMPCYNYDYDQSVGVCCHNALGLVGTVRQIPPATPSGFDVLFRTRPRALWQQTPPEPVLILQWKYDMGHMYEFNKLCVAFSLDTIQNLLTVTLNKYI